MKMKSILKRFDKIDASSISDAKLAGRVRKLQANRKQGGFTLLELLVVVAILAAIAGTAAIALQDTDARASAAAHVAMMDELNKGIRTYRVLNKNQLPTRFDSLLETGATITSGAFAQADVNAVASTDFVENAGFDPADGLAEAALDTDVLQVMRDGGINELRYVSTAATGVDGEIAGVEDCDNLVALVASKKNAVVAGNVFMSPAANGCGGSVNLPETVADTLSVAMWTGGTERLTGQTDPAGAGSAYNADDNFAYLAVGLGPSSNLFDANHLGGMTTVPVYRHVGANEYNRFIAVFNIGTYDSTNGGTDGIVPAAQAVLTAVVDGALDTKEEELGEWDGTRNTI